MPGLHKFLPIGWAVAFIVVANPLAALAQICQSPQALTSCTPSGSIRAELGQANIAGLVYDNGPSGFTTVLTADGRQSASQQTLPGAPPLPHPAAASGPPVGPVLCRRDDYLLLPPAASAGVPCGGGGSTTATDPRDFARNMFDHMDLPSLKLDMNPRLGMVAVPTWFWVTGYDGNLISLTDNLVLTHQECSTVVDTDVNGNPVTHHPCHTVIDTLTVQVRAWPRTYHWSFGDDQEQTVRCPEIAACREGIGLAFTDPHTPSPIAHAYRWSSLGANGSADAYTIGLGITFGAQYRFSTNGGPQTGWASLADRDLGWSAGHQVQEAQAVLTRP